ncbi:MAG: hypothetical protein ACO1NY_04945 [Pseudorhodoplanes sp.]
MADYYPLIQRAIAGLDKNTGEARRALYERARTALVAQLRGVNPPLPEAEITRERLALEEAIRKVEAEAARRTRIDPPAPPPAAPAGASAPRFPNAAPPAATRPARPPVAPPQTAPKPPGPLAPPPAAPPSAARPGAVPPPKFPPAPPRQPGPGVGQGGGQGIGQGPAAAPRTPGNAAPPPGAPPPGRDPFGELSNDFDRLMEPRLAQEDFNREMRPPAREDGRAQPVDPFRDPPPGGARPPRPPSETDDEEEDEGGSRRSKSGLIKAAVAVVLVLGLGWFAWSQRGLVTDMLQSFRGSQTQQTAKDSKSGQPAAGRKIPDRLGSQDTQSGPGVAQRVVLYEEEPNDPQGRRYVGSAIWRTETVSPGPGRPPETTIRADVEIPEKRLNMTFSIRRNTDQALPASHTLEVMFNLPADFVSGGISNVPGVLMKQAEQTRGTPLAGLAVKVTNNFFLIGLSAVDADQSRNIQLLKERGWFDIPIVYNNNRRAILAIEKGTPGERAFQEAFAAWKQ